MLHYALSNSTLSVNVVFPSHELLALEHVWHAFVGLIGEMVQTAPHYRPSAKAVFEVFNSLSYQLVLQPISDKARENFSSESIPAAIPAFSTN